MKNIIKSTIIFFCFVLITCASNAQFTKLHDFNGLNGDEPEGSLITDGTYFYGMTHKGGTNQKGIIFKIKVDGTQFTKLMDFNDNNGSYPTGSLFFDGTFLYGAPMQGGTNVWGGLSYDGNLIRIKPDGTSYMQLLCFNGNNGDIPQCTLITDGTFLYGTTHGGGQDNRGVIFKIRPDGTGYSKLYEFLYPNTNGRGPENSLYYDGTFLYGTTWDGGTYGYGVIFKIKTDGTGFTKIFDFNQPTGCNPHCALISDSTYLYGTTAQGGTNNYGVIFKIKPDGTDYQTLFNFSGFNGKEPLGSLIFAGGYLYGMTELGGANGWGTIFKISTDGIQFKTVYNFKLADGCCPAGSLISAGGFVYGMTNRGGAYGNGTIFKLDTITPKIIDNSITIYPNPFSSDFSIDFHQRKINQLEIKIHNILGQSIFFDSEVNTSEIKTIYLNELPGGIYFLELTGEGERTIRKIVKQ